MGNEQPVYQKSRATIIPCKNRVCDSRSKTGLYVISVYFFVKLWQVRMSLEITKRTTLFVVFLSRNDSPMMTMFTNSRFFCATIEIQVRTMRQSTANYVTATDQLTNRDFLPPSS